MEDVQRCPNRPVGWKRKRGKKERERSEIEIKRTRSSHYRFVLLRHSRRVARGNIDDASKDAIGQLPFPPPLPPPSPAPTPPLPSLRRRVTTRMKIVITRTVATIIASVSRLQFATVWKRSGDYSTNHLVTFNYRSCSLPPPPSSKSRESSTLENVAEFLPSPLLRTG